MSGSTRSPSWRRRSRSCRPCADDQPAKLVGHRGGDHGVLPAGLARRLADSDTAWVRRLVCDPVDGRLLAMDPHRRRFDGALRRFVVYRDATSRRPHSSTPIYDIDHIHRHADGGPTVAANAQGLGKADHILRDLPGWTVTTPTGDAADQVYWTTPTGYVYQTRPPPILGSGDTRPPPTQSRHGPRKVVIEHHRLPLPLEYTGAHPRQPDAA